MTVPLTGTVRGKVTRLANARITAGNVNGQWELPGVRSWDRPVDGHVFRPVQSPSVELSLIAEPGRPLSLDVGSGSAWEQLPGTPLWR